MKPNAFSERECYEAVIQSEAKTKRRGSSDVCCALICLAKPQSTIRCTMPVDIASDYPIYRLSALLCMAIYKRLSAVLYSVSRYYNRLPALLYSVWRCYKQLSNLPTIRSDLCGDATNDSLLCSILSRDTTTGHASRNYLLYRLSALI